MGDLALLLVQVVYLQAQQVAGGGEGKAGAGGVVRKMEMPRPESNTLVEMFAPEVTQGVGHGEDGVQLVVGLVQVQ